MVKPPRRNVVATILFPAIVAISLTTPVLIPGALAFDIQHDFDLSPAEIGVIVAVFYLLSSAATLAAMPLAGRFRPVSMARFGLFLCAASTLGAGVLGNKTALVTMCIVSGLANGLATPSANVLIALTVPQGRRGLAFGLRVSAVPAATALTAIGAYVVVHSALGWRAVVLATSVTCCAILLASLAVDSGKARPDEQPTPDGGGEDLVPLRLLAFGGLLAATACSTLAPFLVGGLITGGADAGDAAVLLGVSAWIGVLARISAGMIADRAPLPRRHLTATSVMLLTAVCGMVALGLGQGITVLATATVVTFGIGWAWPGLLQHATVALHPHHVARATSYLQLGTFTGAVLGPLGFGMVVERGSYELAFLITAAVAGSGAAAIALGNRLHRGGATTQ